MSYNQSVEGFSATMSYQQFLKDNHKQPQQLMSLFSSLGLSLINNSEDYILHLALRFFFYLITHDASDWHYPFLLAACILTLFKIYYQCGPCSVNHVSIDGMYKVNSTGYSYKRPEVESMTWWREIQKELGKEMKSEKIRYTVYIYEFSNN